MINTHHNNALRISDVNQHVTLRGWVAKSRRMGGLIFIDLRDRFGVTQLTIAQDHKDFHIAESLRSEFVIYATGKVVERQNKNPQLDTGDIEVEIQSLSILNVSQTPPIQISDDSDALEDTRLKYRYLDLRRPVMQKTLMLRSQITHALRTSLIKKGFYELETPILGKSTPEGARDFLVPSRLYEGAFYALPQSPQIFKQLYMIAGLEKYFQVAKCFRDEDLRADRQLEFTQLDIEASFVNQEDMIDLVEEMMVFTFKDVLDVKIDAPFERMSYEHAMKHYGSDKPDIRFKLTFESLPESIKTTASSLELQASVCVRIPQLVGRKDIDALTETFKKHGGHILAYLKYDGKDYSGSLNKHISDDLKPHLNMKENETLFVSIGNENVRYEALGAVRLHLGRMFELIDPNTYKFLWVVDFPLFEYDDEEKRFYAKHHPFTAPRDVLEMTKDPLNAKAHAYDIVLNGYELGGGSMRIYQQDVQQKMFEMLGMDEKTIQERFGFFTEALQYGTPPHGGIALGLDRLVMLMTHRDNIKDVIAFPKTQSARDVMMDAPSNVDDSQLEDIHLEVKK